MNRANFTRAFGIRGKEGIRKRVNHCFGISPVRIATCDLQKIHDMIDVTTHHRAHQFVLIREVLVNRPHCKAGSLCDSGRRQRSRSVRRDDLHGGLEHGFDCVCSA